MISNEFCENLNKQLYLFCNPRFDSKCTTSESDIDYINSKSDIDYINKTLAKLKTTTIIRDFDYDWIFDELSYNNLTEMYFQVRLLHVLSEISVDHPHYQNCGNIVIRFITSSTNRTEVRKIEQYNVILISAGYMATLKMFCSIWFKSQTFCNHDLSHIHKKSDIYSKKFFNYLWGLSTEPQHIYEDIVKFISSSLLLLNNQVPPIHNSIFDDPFISVEDYGLEFSQICNSMDAFLLFHEVAHILCGHEFSTRELIQEVAADKGSISLCIIDHSIHKVDSPFMSGGTFFALEGYDLYIKVLNDFLNNDHDNSIHFTRLEELEERIKCYAFSFQEHFPKYVFNIYDSWFMCMQAVRNTFRWTILQLMCDLENDEEKRSLFIKENGDMHAFVFNKSRYGKSCPIK